MEGLIKIFQNIALFDIVYLFFTVYFVIKCFKDGFILSILSISKWILAYIITLILFPKIKPYFKNLLDNEYVLDLGLGLTMFIIVIFIILLISKGISKAISFSGLGILDRIFGLFFGFFISYVVIVCTFTTLDIVYDHKKWPIKLTSSFTFPWVEKGSNYLIKVFPNEKDYQNAKDKVQDI